MMIVLRTEEMIDPKHLFLSVVIPVFNEEDNLGELYERLKAVLEKEDIDYEILFVDDGSYDSSLSILTGFAEKDAHVVVVSFNRNYGQHAAVMAGFEQSSGDVVVTMDADLQNPPEEIPRLIAKVLEGHDVVGTKRRGRRDNVLRRVASKAVNRIMRRILRGPMSDYGCMLRAYRKEIVESMVRCGEISTFVPALAVRFAANPTEIEVEHDARKRGETKYPLFNLFMLLFDLITGFSMLPMRLMTVFGGLVALVGTGFGVFLLLRRLIVGPEVEGVFTLFSILFVFVGLLFLSLGLMGEYIGRIYGEVRRRPRFVVKKIYRKEGPRRRREDFAAPSGAPESAESTERTWR